MLEADKDYLPAILGMSTGFMIERSQHKARNLLKRVAKMEVSLPVAHSSHLMSLNFRSPQRTGKTSKRRIYFSQSFMSTRSPSPLAAPSLTSPQGKNDLAQDLCKRCLAQNKSCSQAWEILALAMEKDMDYRNAADCYEKVDPFLSDLLLLFFSSPQGMETRIRSLRHGGFQTCFQLFEVRDVRGSH